MKNRQEINRILFVAFLIHLFWVLVFSISYTKYIEIINSKVTNIYLIANHLSHFLIFAFLPLIVATLFAFFASKRIVSTVFIIISSIVLIFLKLDAIVYGQFRYHLSPIVFKLAFGKRAGDIFQFSTSNYIKATLFIIGVFLLQYFMMKLAYFIAKEFEIKYRKSILIGFFTLMLICNFLYAYSDANNYRPVTQLENVYPAYFPLTADSLMYKLNLVDENMVKSKANIELIQKSSQLNYPIHELKKSSVENKKNLLLIVVDSWRYDCLTQEITPNIYNLKSKSANFNHHYSGSNMTTGGIFSLLYGIPATYFDAFTDVEKGAVIIDELQKQNYELQILSSSTIENPPFNKNAFSKVNNLRLFSNGNTAAERDIDIYNEFSNFLNTKKDKPFFGFLFFDAAHAFDFPKEYNAPFKPYLDEVDYLALTDNYNPKLLINRYKNSLHFIDSLIGKVMKDLEKNNLLQETIIIITADHGQEFNDNKKGYWQHGGNFSDVQIKVPFILFDSNLKPKEYNHLSLHYDVVPTLLKNYLGIINSFSDYTCGEDLFLSKNRNSFICGYNQKFAIIENKRIVKVFNSGIFEVVDKNLNLLNQQPNDAYLLDAMKQMKQFYK